MSDFVVVCTNGFYSLEAESLEAAQRAAGRRARIYFHHVEGVLTRKAFDMLHDGVPVRDWWDTHLRDAGLTA